MSLPDEPRRFNWSCWAKFVAGFVLWIVMLWLDVTSEDDVNNVLYVLPGILMSGLSAKEAMELLKVWKQK